MPELLQTGIRPKRHGDIQSIVFAHVIGQKKSGGRTKIRAARIRRLWL
jgi:hypothetical protein